MKPKTYRTEFCGKELSLTVGEMANLATGAVTVTYGDTVVLVTAVVSDEPREGVDFFPLMVDYEERLYAAGKISGSRFIKREGRPSENAVLNARLIDRPIRPLFPKGFRNDVQIVATILSIGENDPDMPAMLGTSAALQLTHAPFQGPIAGVRVGRTAQGELIFNPTIAEQVASDLDLVVAAHPKRVMMLEAGAQQIPEDTILEAIRAAHAKMRPVFELQEQLQREMRPALDQEHAEETVVAGTELNVELAAHVGDKLKAAIREFDKETRNELLKQYENEILSMFEGNYKQIDIKSAFGALVEKEVRQAVLEDGIRPDGRQINEIRQLTSKVGLLPRTHGSALFTRGQTQVLSIVTLGGPGEEQIVETMEEEGEKRFMHHYNFPPFSVGEVKPMRSVSRREIGHGALAERAVKAVLPPKNTFPYTIRVVSEVLSSNGSSSMASTCGAILALMDAGVPLEVPVGGIAIGLITEEGFNEDANKGYRLLTDIQGIEDFGGDMDFKVTGTTAGITAIQLDMKVKGLPMRVIEETLEQARDARFKILEHMQQTLAGPRTELSQFAPRILTIQIPQEKIGDVIGPGGKTIKALVDEAGGKSVTAINIDEDGLVAITSTDAEKAAKAAESIKQLVADLEIGQTYQGEVVAIKKNPAGSEIGAIVQIGPKKEGMVHISEVANERIPDISSRVKVGETVRVKVLEIDRDRGRMKLSMKQAE